MSKNKDFLKEISKLNKVDLAKIIEEFRKNKLSLQLASSTAHIRDISQFKKLKKNLARALTVFHQKDSELEGEKNAK